MPCSSMSEMTVMSGTPSVGRQPETADALIFPIRNFFFCRSNEDTFFQFFASLISFYSRPNRPFSSDPATRGSMSIDPHKNNAGRGKSLSKGKEKYFHEKGPRLLRVNKHEHRNYFLHVPWDSGSLGSGIFDATFVSSPAPAT